MTYLVLTGHQLRNVTPDAQPLITDRFTQSSIELYGEPKVEEARQLITNEYFSLAEAVGNPQVDQERLTSTLGILHQALGCTIDLAPSKEQDLQYIAGQFKEILVARYGKVLETFDEVEATGGKVDLEDVTALFQSGIDTLAQTEPAWRDWKAVVTNGEGMSTNTKDKQIEIGRKGNYLAERMKPLFLHEALKHGLRSINGHKLDDMLGKGLPGNLDVEEGAGIFDEFAFSGIMPQRIYDRYTDTSLALGQLNLPPMNRSEMHKFMVNRRIVRDQAAGKSVDVGEIKKSTWNAVDRIYRGTLGNDIVGVNTKDIAYYQGFLKYTDYLKDQIEVQGKMAEEVFDYIMLGCFDPSDPRHRDYVAAHV